MEYQSSGKPERSKGVNIKQALKIMLVLVVCTWMLYQIKNTRNKTENYGDQTKLASRYEAISLGRKGLSSRLDERTFPESINVDSVGEDKESSDGRDDVSDGAKEDKAEEEFGHINKQFRTNEGKEVELGPESQEMESKIQKNVVESATNAGVIEEIDEVESFHDENGVPPDGNDTERVVGQVYILHEINFE